jgi:hypothetical protein
MMLMRRRFRFELGDSEYGVFGEFGAEPGFSVVQLLPGQKTDSSGMKILAMVPADSAEQLKLALEKKFPGLTGLRPF